MWESIVMYPWETDWKWDTLVKFIEDLNPFSPDTNKMIILSTFNAFARRIMQVGEQAKLNAPEHPSQKIYDSDDEDEGSGDEATTTNSMTLLPPNLFDYIIVDEAHRAKNPYTRNWNVLHTYTRVPSSP